MLWQLEEFYKGILSTSLQLLGLLFCQLHQVGRKETPEVPVLGRAVEVGRREGDDGIVLITTKAHTSGLLSHVGQRVSLHDALCIVESALEVKSMAAGGC